MILGIAILLFMVIGYFILLGISARQRDRKKDDGFVEGFMVGSMYNDDGDKFF